MDCIFRMGIDFILHDNTYLYHLLSVSQEQPGTGGRLKNSSHQLSLKPQLVKTISIRTNSQQWLANIKL